VAALNRQSWGRTLGAAAMTAACALAGCSGDGDSDPTPERTAAVEPTASAMPPPVDPAIDRFLADALPSGVSGTFLAGRGDQIVDCEGFGWSDRAARLKAGCDTVYDIQSITKQFTAAAILKLEMMGRLQVSDPIRKYVGPVPPDKRDITIHQLLTHTSGLPEVLGGDYEPLTRKQMLAGAMSVPLQSPPGTRYRYSNLGYSVLAAIIEKASGMGYEEFLASHLFEPAGMTQTGYQLPDWNPQRVAVEYDRHGRSHGRPYDHPWAADGPYWNLRGNGGILTTAPDMFRWNLALRGDEVLSRAAKAKLFTPYVREGPRASTFYGYGWVVAHHAPYGKVVWHDGGNGWSRSMVARLPDSDVFVFWTSNHAYQQGRWNLENSLQKLTIGIAKRTID
jgi:CubicO group peptidase (beta-lactamase class C family)